MNIILGNLYLVFLKFFKQDLETLDFLNNDGKFKRVPFRIYRL